MNFKKTVLIGGLALAANAPSFGQFDAVKRYDKFAEDQTEFEILHVREPNFPLSLKNADVMEGRASFLILVDQYGSLADYLLYKATHIEFAKEVEKVITDWRFSVPYVDRQPVPIVTSFDVHFKRTGVVVESIGNLLPQWQRSKGDSDGYRIHGTDELDSIPEPIEIVRPDFHVDLLEGRNLITAVFDFYIDTEGNVRMPTLREADNKVDERLLVIAQEALLQWRFNTPTVNRKPVVAKTAIPFHFKRGQVVSSVFEQ